jgi:hypothetical protein
MGILGAVLLCAVVQATPPPKPQPPPVERVKVFLGQQPRKDGFVTTNKNFQDSYRDMAEAYREDGTLQAVLKLVDDPTEADLILEITSRKHNPWANSLTATLSVVGSDYKSDLDGKVGVRSFTYKNLAKSLLRQTAEWVKANRVSLDKVRAARAAKSPQN